MELYVFYDTVANTNCQSESSKKFHNIPGFCGAAVIILGRNTETIRICARMLCFHGRKVVN